MLQTLCKIMGDRAESEREENPPSPDPGVTLQNPSSESGPTVQEPEVIETTPEKAKAPVSSCLVRSRLVVL